MGNGMNKVLPGLYVGNYRDSKDAAQLEKHQISHIISIHDAARRMYPEKEYLCILASDSPDQNLLQFFPVCNDFIHSARLKEGNVLIHCLAGMSRSVTVAVAYIMSVTELNWQDALKAVRGARAVANPNIGFQKQLQKFEATRLLEERRRMLEKFPDSPLNVSDEETCRKLMTNYNSLMLSRTICEGKCLPRVCPTGACRASQHRIFRRKPCQQQLQQQTKLSDSLPSSPTSVTPPASPRSWNRGSFHQQTSAPHPQQRVPCVLYRARERTDSLTSIRSLPSNTVMNSLEAHTPPPRFSVSPLSIPGPWDRLTPPARFSPASSLPTSPRHSRPASPTPSVSVTSLPGLNNNNSRSALSIRLPSTSSRNGSSGVMRARSLASARSHSLSQPQLTRDRDRRPP